jgi:putative transposase
MTSLFRLHHRLITVLHTRLQQNLEVLPRRWVVERTFAWLSQNRRMSKDYERLCVTGEAFVYAAMSRLMVRRLVRS